MKQSCKPCEPTSELCQDCEGQPEPPEAQPVPLRLRLTPDDDSVDLWLSMPGLAGWFCAAWPPEVGHDPQK